MPKKVAELIKELQPKDELPTIEKMMETPDIAQVNGARLEKILKLLEENSHTNKETSQAVRFIKHYFLWGSVYNTIKIVLLVAIIVLGIISWDSIVNSLLKIYG